MRAGSLRASSQKSALMRIGRELKVERNCLVKLSSVIVLGGRRCEMSLVRDEETLK